MKKTIITSLIFIAALSLCTAQEADVEEASNTSSINIDEIAEELATGSEEETEVSPADEIEEEVVFDEETAADNDEENTAPVINEKYWRGKVSVASANEYPKGLFAMAKGYFPGDTLTVINGKTQGTVNVLIIGSIDQNDDTGIKFSVEAASALKISDQTDANVVLDERINPPEVRETATAKLIIFGLDQNDYSSLEQPLSVAEDEAILSNNEDVIEEALSEVVVAPEEAENNAPAELPSDFEVVALSELEPQPAENIVETNTANPDMVSDESYAPIILTVPETVEEIAKDEEEIIEEPEVEDEGSASKSVVISIPQEEKTEPAAAVQPPKPVESYAPSAPKAPVPYKSLIADEKMVRPGYYIQLAFLTNEENLQKFVDKYCGSLKIFLIPHKNGYKVYSGVYNDDDKTHALEYINQLGFKDAFIKKLGK